MLMKRELYYTSCQILIPLHCLEMLLTLDCYDTVSKVTWESRPAPLGVAKLLPMAFCGHVAYCGGNEVRSEYLLADVFSIGSCLLIWLGLASGLRLLSVTDFLRSRKVPARSRLFVSISQLMDMTPGLICLLLLLYSGHLSLSYHTRKWA